MAGLKLPKLPTRVPVKLVITLTPELKKALDTYAIVYRETYGQEEAVADLIPAMLAQFLASDRGFAKARDARGSNADAQ